MAVSERIQVGSWLFSVVKQIIIGCDGLVKPVSASNTKKTRTQVVYCISLLEEKEKAGGMTVFVIK